MVHIPDNVFKLLAWCGDNVERVCGEMPVWAATALRETRDAMTLTAWLDKLRQAQTPEDVQTILTH